MITITESAANELKRTMAEQDASPDVYVRVSILGGGCSGFKFNLMLEEGGITDKDEVFEVDGIKVVVDNRSSLYLDGVKLDFLNDINNRGFKFDSDRIKSRCGCGSSVNF